MKVFVAVLLSLVTLGAVLAQPETPFPSALAAKQKHDDFLKAKTEKEKLDSKCAELAEQLRLTRNELEKASSRLNKAKEDADHAKIDFQKEMRNIRESLDASLKLLDNDGQALIAPPEKKIPDPPVVKKTAPEEPKKDAFKDSFMALPPPTPSEPTLPLDYTLTPIAGLGNTGRLTVHLPAAAKLWIGEQATKEKGAIRLFVTPDLSDDNNHYNLKVQMPDLRVIERDVPMKAGQQTTTTFK